MSNATEIRQAAAQTIDTFIAAVRGSGVTVSDEAVEFIKDNPAFLSMPAMRVACRAPSFINIFDPANNAGALDMNKEFEFFQELKLKMHLEAYLLLDCGIFHTQQEF